MNRILTRVPTIAAAVVLIASFAASDLQAQAATTFTACRVPDVGAIYMIGVSGAPSECLDPSHVEFSWTEGGSGSIADGSVTTAKLADDAVTTAKVADGAVTTPKIAADAVTSAEIQDGTVQAADMVADAIDSPLILDGSVRTEDIEDGTITTNDIADGTIARADLAGGVGEIARTVVTYTGAAEDPAPSLSPVQLRVVGSFTKASPNTDIQIVWNSHVLATGGICNFHVRVDGSASPSGTLGAVTSGSEYSPVSTTNVFTGLATGSHEITVWVRGVSATSCTENPGNYLKHVVITEYEG